MGEIGRRRQVPPKRRFLPFLITSQFNEYEALKGGGSLQLAEEAGLPRDRLRCEE
jgi:hypothetical protein